MANPNVSLSKMRTELDNVTSLAGAQDLLEFLYHWYDRAYEERKDRFTAYLEGAGGRGFEAEEAMTATLNAMDGHAERLNRLIEDVKDLIHAAQADYTIAA